MASDGREIVRRETVVDHPYLRVDVAVERDARGREHEYVIGSGPDVAFAIPLWPDGTVSLNRQRRVGLDELSLEVPGGHVDPGEDPLAAARRELREETGLRAARLTPLLSCLLSTKVQQRLHYFRAEELTPGEHARDPDEEIEVVRMPVEEALRRVRAGEVLHGPTVTALLLLADTLRPGSAPA